MQAKASGRASTQAATRTGAPARAKAAAAGATRAKAGAKAGARATTAPRRLALGAGLLALWVLGGCGGGVSGEVGRACMAGGRDAANPQLCSCVQGVATQVLSRSEQGRAARLFQDPNLAQEIRQSNHPRDESFWRRYTAFAERAEALCG